jgi:hypothetical protein
VEIAGVGFHGCRHNPDEPKLRIMRAVLTEPNPPGLGGAELP